MGTQSGNTKPVNRGYRPSSGPQHTSDDLNLTLRDVTQSISTEPLALDVDVTEEELAIKHTKSEEITQIDLAVTSHLASHGERLMYTVLTICLL